MLKKTIASIAVGGILLGGAASASSAAASTPASSTPASSTPASSKTSTTGHPIRRWLRRHRHELRQEAIAIGAKTIGVSTQDLVSELRAGKSGATIATEHNVSPQTVVNALVSAADARVSQAETKNRITSTEASKIDAALPAKVTALVNKTF